MALCAEPAFGARSRGWRPRPFELVLLQPHPHAGPGSCVPGHVRLPREPLRAERRLPHPEFRVAALPALSWLSAVALVIVLAHGVRAIPTARAESLYVETADGPAVAVPDTPSPQDCAPAEACCVRASYNHISYEVSSFLLPARPVVEQCPNNPIHLKRELILSLPDEASAVHTIAHLFCHIFPLWEVGTDTEKREACYDGFITGNFPVSLPRILCYRRRTARWRMRLLSG